MGLCLPPTVLLQPGILNVCDLGVSGSLISDPVAGRLVLKYGGARVGASGRCGSVEVTAVVQFLKIGLVQATENHNCHFSD